MRRRSDPHLGPALRLRLAAADLVAEPLRTVLAVIVLAPMAASWFLLASVATSLDGIGRAGEERNLLITQPEVFDFANLSVGEREIGIAESAAGDDAESVTPLIVRVVKVGDRLLQLRAAATDTWATVDGLLLIDGAVPRAGADEMAVTEAVQAATHWRIGQQVRVFGSALTITGILRGSGSKVASMWVTLERAERLFERPGEFQFVVVRLAAGVDGDAVHQRLRTALPDHVVLDESALQAEATRGLRSLGQVVRVLTVVGMLGLAIGSANATALTLVERRRSIAVLRVLGLPARSILGLLRTRAMLTAGAAIGLGLAVAWPMVANRSTFLLRSFTVHAQVSWFEIATGSCLSLLSAWVGATFSARRVLRAGVRSLVGS
jgi:hypothetical protein